MSSKLKELKPHITVIGVGGAGGNAINNMIASGIDGVEFIAANTDAQALISSSAERRIQLGADLTEGLGAGAKPEIGAAAAQEAIEDIKTAVEGSHMVFIAAGMGGGTGTGAAAVIARAAKEMGILTVAIVTKPFNFEGSKRLRAAEAGINELRDHVDTLIVIPNQNLFRIANERTTFAEAFQLADRVLHSGIACITDLIVREGLINLDFADVRAVMTGMGSAMMGTGEAAGERRAIEAAELAILNPLLDDVSLRGAQGLLVSISGSRSLTLYEVDEAASRVRQEVDPEANIIIGATFDETLGDRLRVSIVAAGLEPVAARVGKPAAKPSVTARMPEPAPQLPAAAVDTYWEAPQAYEAAPQPQQPGDWQQQPGYDQTERAPQPVWNAPNDVVIELGPAPMAGSPQLWSNERDDRQPVQTPEFRPQPPLDHRRAPRRMPEVEDFPPFAQQALRAKRQEPTPPQPAAMERKRGGFFTFLTGRKDATAPRTDSAPETRSAQRPRREPAAGSVNNQVEFGEESDTPPQRRIPMPRQRPRQS